MNKAIIKNTINFVKIELEGAEGGHDWFHIERVYNNTKLIAKTEDVSTIIVELAALLHDIADPKFNDGDEQEAPRKISAFLKEQDCDDHIIEHVINIVQNMSYSKSLSKNKLFHSLELAVVQDADRLDAIGAIGIARAFNYGGFKNRSLYNPEIKPQLDLTKEEYRKSTAPTINHFYEKLLLLKNKMNTVTGKKIAANRHQFMVDYLQQFNGEWNGEK